MAAGSETTERRRRGAGAASANGRERGGASAESNGMTEIATDDLERLLAALKAARAGESGVRLPARKRGLVGEIATAFN